MERARCTPRSGRCSAAPASPACTSRAHRRDVAVRPTASARGVTSTSCCHPAHGPTRSRCCWPRASPTGTRGLRWRTSEDHALTLWHDPRRQMPGTARRPRSTCTTGSWGSRATPSARSPSCGAGVSRPELAGLDVWFPDLTQPQPDPGAQRRARPRRDQGARGPAPPRWPPRPDADWRRTIALARRVDALRGAARRARDGARRPRPGGAYLPGRRQVSAAWRLRAQGSSRTAVRIEELRSLGTVAKIRTMVAAWVVPSPAVIRYRDPRAADSTWRLPAGVRRPLPPGGARARRGGARAPSAAASAAGGRSVTVALDLLGQRVEVDCDDPEGERVVRASSPTCSPTPGSDRLASRRGSPSRGRRPTPGWRAWSQPSTARSCGSAPVI